MSTKQKLIQAALELFGEHGYDAASVRDICEKAGVNNASVNYHFGDKRSLYRAVLEQEVSNSSSLKKAIPTGTAAERLHCFVETALLDIYKVRDTASGKLGFREIADPSAELIDLIKEPLKLQFDAFLDVIKELSPPSMSEDDQKLAAIGIMGQIEYHRFFYKFLPRFIGDDEIEELTPKKLADHITAFSIRALGV